MIFSDGKLNAELINPSIGANRRNYYQQLETISELSQEMSTKQQMMEEKEKPQSFPK